MISKSEFLELAKSYQIIPIVDSVFSGTETPLTIFEKLASSKPGSFLLESAEAGVWSRYSFIGVENYGFLVSSDSAVKWKALEGNSPVPFDGKSLDGLSELEALELMQDSWKAATVAGLPAVSINTAALYMVTDATSATDCTAGGGTMANICFSSGVGVWVDA